MTRTKARANHKTFASRMKKRCSIDKCRKLVKDNGLCRIHSPMREGFEK